MVLRLSAGLVAGEVVGLVDHAIDDPLGVGLGVVVLSLRGASFGSFSWSFRMSGLAFLKSR